MDLDNPVVKLCMEGTRAEFEGRFEDACALYLKAWDTSQDDFEACVSAHYVARIQTNLHDILYWNQESLNRADAVNDERVKDFYPSLYLNMGRSHELIGDQAEAHRYYALAARLGFFHGGHMTEIDMLIHKFMADYGKALSAGDLTGIVNCWDVPALVLSDQGARAVLEVEEVEQFFSGAVEWYRAQGIMATEPGSVEVKQLSERLVSADVGWSVFDASGAKNPGEHSFYILSLSDDGQPRIRVAIALAAE